MVRILFKPFDAEKWFIIGFAAWLAQLSGSFNPRPFLQISRYSQQNHIRFLNIKQFFDANIETISILAIPIALIAFAFSVLLIWLSSRARFIFLNSVVNNVADIKKPWHELASLANSLFFFRILAGIISVAVMFIMVAMFALFLGFFKTMPVLFLLPAYLPFTILLLAIIMVFVFTKDFVVPIMFRCNIKIIAAWKKFLNIFSSNKIDFLLYLVMRIFVVSVFYFLIVALVLGTCGMACCFLGIPYIGTVLILPFLVFIRAFSLCFLQQFGIELDIFPISHEQPESVDNA